MGLTVLACLPAIPLPANHVQKPRNGNRLQHSLIAMDSYNLFSLTLSVRLDHMASPDRACQFALHITGLKFFVCARRNLPSGLVAETVERQL